jgi:hypothetical protein
MIPNYNEDHATIIDGREGGGYIHINMPHPHYHFCYVTGNDGKAVMENNVCATRDSHCRVK